MVNLTVLLQATGFSRTTVTDTGGQYAFLDAPVGTFTVRAADPGTEIPSEETVTILENQVIVQDINLVALGIVQVQATFTDMIPVDGAPVHIRKSAIGDFFVSVGSTDTTGVLSISGVPAGNFTVRVFHPNNAAIVTEAGGTVTTAGEIIVAPVVIALDSAPIVTLTSPLPGDSFIEGSFVTLAATASDDFGVTSVEFLINGVVVGTAPSPPFSIEVPIALMAGAESITARAVDTAGSPTESAAVPITVLADTSPPTVILTAPTDGTTVIEGDRKSTRLNSSHTDISRMPSSA